MERKELSHGAAVTIFDLPPEGFDPLNASARELKRYGFPVPHNETQRRLLETVYARIGPRLKPIQPEIRIRPPRGKTGRRRDRNVASDTETNWAGASVQISNAQSPLSYVAAGLVVPNVAGPPGTYSEHWVGLDTLGDVCQAGIECDGFRNDPETAPFAWVEWAPGPMMQLYNFRVFPGDSIYILVCVDVGSSPLSATAYFTNNTQGTSASFGFEAPKTANFFGLTAEWISERPTDADTQLVRFLANFGDAFFFEAVAGNATDTLQPQPGDDIQMIRSLGDQTVICKSAVPATGLVHTTWVAPS